MGTFRSDRTLVKLGLTAAMFAVLAMGFKGVSAQGGGQAAGAAQGGGRGAAGGGGGQGGGGGRGPAMPGGDPILNGVIDLHSHNGPDSRPRSLDFLDLARYAKAKGMRGLVLKSHLDHTAVQAFVARKEVPGLEVFGTIDLNWTHGGMNPVAVEHFAQVSMPGSPAEGYGRMVMMSSDDSLLQLQVNKSNDPPVYVVKNGQVVPEAKAVIGVIKKHNLSMTTGHNSGAEAILLIKEAIAQGINPVRLSVTHANINPPGLTAGEMKAVGALGSFVEFCGQSQRAFTPEQQKALDTRNDRIADLIRQVGPDHIIMETDLGQGGNEYIPDGIAAFIRAMRARGISAADTDKMTRDNPAKFLGIPAPAPNPTPVP